MLLLLVGGNQCGRVKYALVLKAGFAKGVWYVCGFCDSLGSKSTGRPPAGATTTGVSWSSILSTAAVTCLIFLGRCHWFFVFALFFRSSFFLGGARLFGYVTAVIFIR